MDQHEGADVGKAILDFLDAFDRMDWNVFEECFDAQASGFFPSPPFPEYRANSSAEIVPHFKTYFEAVRLRSPGPLYLNLTNEDLDVDLIGEIAIVMFHLKSARGVPRRTFVVKKTGGRWLIRHMHASNRERQAST